MSVLLESTDVRANLCVGARGRRSLRPREQMDPHLDRKDLIVFVMRLRRCWIGDESEEILATSQETPKDWRSKNARNAGGRPYGMIDRRTDLSV